MPMASFFTALALTHAPQADGPSFDRARATTLSEQTICADPALARLDRRMAERYAAVRRAGSSELHWLSADYGGSQQE